MIIRVAKYHIDVLVNIIDLRAAKCSVSLPLPRTPREMNSSSDNFIDNIDPMNSSKFAVPELVLMPYCLFKISFWLKASLIYRAGSGIAKATQRNPVSQKIKLASVSQDS